jgi:hypothetical protein
LVVCGAHGARAGLMLVPIYLGLCQAEELDSGHRAAALLIGGNLQTAIAVSVAHAAAMIVTGGTIAFAVHRCLRLKFISSSWFNVDIVWALSLVLVGLLGVLGATNLI